MNRLRSAAPLGVFLVLAACAPRGPQTGVPPGRFAMANETLRVTVAPARAEALVVALQSNAVLSAGASVSVGPALPVRRSTAMAAAAYADALADARLKASAIAQRLGVPLGKATAIEEVDPRIPSAAGFPAPMRGVPVEKGLMVRGPASGVVTLLVSFVAGGVPIAVYGVYSTASPMAGVRGANGATVTIAAHASSYTKAKRSLDAVDSAVRAIARRFGANVVVTSAYASSSG